MPSTERRRNGDFNDKTDTIRYAPMGWNSWNTFYDQINEELMRTTADAMVSSGLRDAGYRYLILDDCWASRERGADGGLQPDPDKFPHGMEAVAEYVHSRGLKFGLYGCCGTRTCAGYPGSFEHEFEDAARFASWGVDYLKYDNCHHPESIPSHILYRRMNLALRAAGRDIVLAACQWGLDDVHSWARSAGVQSYRSTVDIQDSWCSIERIARAQLEKQSVAGPGCYNDLDMLVVGMYGRGLNPETCIGGCTKEEYRTHFALWAMLGAPLILGCDIRALDEDTRTLLTNRDLIAIDQDAEARGCYKVDVYGQPDAFVLVRQLCGGELALGFFNFSDTQANVFLDLWDIGLPAAVGLRLRDCLSGEEQTARELICPAVPAHGCRVYRAWVKAS